MNLQSNRTFPRGMVLGLTMAETVLLIVFALLLAFAAVFTWQARDLRAATEEKERLEDALADADIERPDIVAIVGSDPRTDGDRWRELVRHVGDEIDDAEADVLLVVAQLASEWREAESPVRQLAEALNEAGLDSSAETLSELTETAEISRGLDRRPAEFLQEVDQLGDALREAGLEASAQTMDELVELVEMSQELERTPAELLQETEEPAKARMGEQLSDALESAGLAADPEVLADLTRAAEAAEAAGIAPRDLPEVVEQAGDLLDQSPEDLAAMSDLAQALDALPGETTPSEVDELTELVSALGETGRSPDEILHAIEQIGPGGGRGTEHPSCLNSGDQRPAYLFDVALSDAGFLLQPTAAPRHDPARSTEPPTRVVEQVTTGRWLTEPEFAEQATPIRRWSDENECVLFVRVWDETPAAGKQLYKQRMRTLEWVFYKLEVTSGAPPAADSDGTSD